MGINIRLKELKLDSKKLLEYYITKYYNYLWKN